MPRLGRGGCAGAADEAAYLLIMVGIEPSNRTPFLDVIDKGEGIPPKQAEKIFEPFFTTSRTGTGLGLYLSKELCEANRARLDYIPLTAGGSCFRISFAISKQNLNSYQYCISNPEKL